MKVCKVSKAYKSTIKKLHLAYSPAADGEDPATSWVASLKRQLFRICLESRFLSKTINAYWSIMKQEKILLGVHSTRIDVFLSF